MDKEEKEFVFGRRHLANMMGKDPETFTQTDINVILIYFNLVVIIAIKSLIHNFVLFRKL